MSAERFTVGSMFAGIGGIDTGFRQAGFEIIWANEIDKYAANTYKHNMGGSSIMVGDIKQSIYRFRNANPDLFKEKYDSYSNSDLGIKIDLLKNKCLQEMKKI